MAAETSSAPDLVATGLKKSYKGRTVVKGVDLVARKGEILGLLGPNGAGKTTTFYMIVGLVRPNEGKIVFQGQDITKYPVYRRARAGLGYLAQEPSIFRKLTVEENVLAILETLPLTRRERRERCEALLADLDLLRLAKQKAYTLSGGERRKLEITRAMVRDPAILMLDEPFAGVDPLSVIELQNIIRKLQQKGLGIIITDHNVRETLSVVNRAYLLYNKSGGGEIMAEGTSEFLINDPEVRKLYLGEDFHM